MDSKNKPMDRIEYFDLIKAAAIFFVCFYHLNTLNVNIIEDSSLITYFHYFIIGICSTGVPLFFMVSGALMLNKNYNFKKHIKKIITISILTVIWAVLTLIVLMPIFGDEYNLSEFLKALWTWKPDRINHLWYLPTLVIVFLLFPLIKEAYDKQNKKVLYYFLTVVFIFTFGNVLLNNLANIAEWVLGVNYLTGNFNFFNIFNLFKGFYAFAIVYFIVGGLLLISLKNKVIKFRGISIVAVLIIALTLLFLYGIVMSLSNGFYFDTVWEGYDTIMTLAVALSIFLLASKINIKNKTIAKLIKIIGSNTLGIYFIHVIIGAFFEKYYRLLPFNQNIIANLFFIVFIVLVSLSVTLLLKKVPIVRELFKI
ncbi:acyltransferase [Solibacillus sp. FSL W7-1436]|uniref:acyltransferase n=1 Tax=Solibacillus sp. FSL W7-1436 TaxID=2921705 RepID=UPI0030F6794C